MSLKWLCLLLASLVLSPTLDAVEGVEESTATVEESTTTAEIPEPDQTTSSGESESKGIIPADAYVRPTSTEPLTPTSFYTAKKPYDQAMDELKRAQALWKAGHAEAASDTALEAYDDLRELRRVPGVKRQTIRAQTHQAATVYIQAGIAYVQGFVKRNGDSPGIRAEGRARLEDLREVARNYPELNRQINKAKQAIAPPTPVSSTETSKN